jgi:hypothetical protein
VRNDGTKAPAGPSWEPYKTTRATPDQMRAWAFEQRDGFGMIAGPVSGYRETWDFDDADTFAAFVAAAAAAGLGDVVQRIRDGYEDQTPSGGRRWIATYPAEIVWKDETFARRPGREGDPPIKTLIETTTFAILAPSNGSTHPSGKAYIRASGGFTTIASYSAEERAALIALARSFDEMPRVSAEPQPVTHASGTRPGDDFNARARWSQILEPHGWRISHTRGDVTYWTRPGKDHGISASTNVHGRDLLWVFSSSTTFDPDKSYTKFGAYALLEHGGDFGRAALALAKEGYGQQADPDRDDRRVLAPTPAAAGASWRWLRDIQRERVDWIWPGRLARGTLSLWIGDGGLGKSRASNDVAARITTGACWPDHGAAPLGSVVILSAEDSPAATIRPAIEAAGGDLSRVAILDAVHTDDGTERTFQLGTDLAALEHVLNVTGAILVIIDPVSAYFGTRLDSYRDTDVRSVLEPVAKLAERRRLVVLGIMHVGKTTDRQARHRALGSVAFVNAARLVFAIGPDPNDADRRLFVPVKANLCREAPTLAFRLTDADGIARVVWEDAPVPGIHADTVLAGTPQTDREDQTDAERVIRDLLEREDWPIPATLALEAGRAHAIPDRTMRWTARRLGITIRRDGFGRHGKWQWHSGNVLLMSAPIAPIAAMTNPSAIEASTTHRGNGNTLPARACEDLKASALAPMAAADEPLPAWVIEPTDPDLSDPIGAHDEEAQTGTGNPAGGRSADAEDGAR